MLSSNEINNLEEILGCLKQYYCSQFNNIQIEYRSDNDLRFNGKLENNTIIINNNHSYKRAEKTLYHEFRHIWQRIYYSDLYNFWLSCSEYKEKFFYRNCSIEKDAIIFSELQDGYDSTDILDEWAYNPRLELEHLRKVYQDRNLNNYY